MAFEFGGKDTPICWFTLGGCSVQLKYPSLDILQVASAANTDSMKVRCPNCQTHIDCETLQISGATIQCTECGSRIDLQQMIEGHSLQQDGGFLDDQTKTLEFSTAELKEGDFVGKFQILQVIGHGGFGNVYKAYDKQLERTVALKIPRRDQQSQLDATAFVQEAQMAASVRDPNIVGVHEVGQDGDNLYICSEFIEGTTLKGWSKADKRPVEAICRMMIRIARSLHKAHLTGLVHRDLKPANVLVDEEGSPFITDFGLARKVIKGSKRPNAGQIEIVGTPAYMSPEQAVGDIDKIDTRTDIYSLGVIFYELTCGHRPFSGEVASIIQDILYHDPQKPTLTNKSIPRELEAIILKAMAKDQKDRYESALDFAEDIEKFLKNEPTIALPLQGGQHLAYFLRKNRALIAVVVTVVIASMATYLVARYWNKPDPEIVEIGSEEPKVTVSIETSPGRANIAVVPIDPETRRPLREKSIQPTELTPLSLELPQGDYVVEAYLPGLGVQEVRRSVTKQDIDDGKGIEFRKILIKALPENMAAVEGGEFEISYTVEGIDKVPYQVSSFYVQDAEVTCGQYQKLMGGLPAGFATFNRYKWNDKTPVTRFTFLEALDYAERAGLRLIDYEEFCFVATNKGTTGVPWGDVVSAQDLVDYWVIGDIGCFEVDKTLPETASIPIQGLFSNVPELTGTTIVLDALTKIGVVGQQNAIAVVGQPVALMSDRQSHPDLPLNARHVGNKSIELIHSLQYPVGFRCARSQEPRFIDTSKIEESE